MARKPEATGGAGGHSMVSHWAALPGFVLSRALCEFDTARLAERYLASYELAPHTAKWAPDSRRAIGRREAFCHASRPTLALDPICGATLGLGG